MINIKEQIESAAHYRAQQIAKGGGKRALHVRRFDLRELHSNQSHEMKQHLTHDSAHRMLDRYKAAPRSPRPHFEGQRDV